MDLIINDIQHSFLMMACNLNWAILQFDITDKDFEEDYGFTKQQTKKAINDLQKQLKAHKKN